jgi:hypothetical protein
MARYRVEIAVVTWYAETVEAATENDALAMIEGSTVDWRAWPTTEQTEGVTITKTEGTP